MAVESTRRDRGHAFTLIELLVVIAIIAILAAILFPVFARARERARQTDCLSNLKQFGVAFRQYTDDYDGYMPRTANTSNSFKGVPPPGSGLPRTGNMDGGPIWPYIRSEAVYYCPSDMNRGRYYPFSYGYNWNVFVNPIRRPRLDQVPPTPIPGSAKYSRMIDIYLLDEWSGGDKDRNRNRIDDNYERHGKGCNVLCSDGHVKFIKGYDYATGSGTH